MIILLPVVRRITLILLPHVGQRLIIAASAKSSHTASLCVVGFRLEVLQPIMKDVKGLDHLILK